MKALKLLLIFGMPVLIILGAAIVNSETVVARAVAEVKGTTPESPIAGRVIFAEMEQGLYVTAELTHVPNPGKHGFHVHEKGDCSNNGNAAGGHYNPAGVTHGHLPTDGHEKAHAGDLGNITINEDGTGSLQVILSDVHLVGEKNNISGLAVILHEKEDDFGQPTGNAGGRIGCGIIQSAESMPVVAEPVPGFLEPAAPVLESEPVPEGN